MSYESSNKMVSHPAHYQSTKGIEVIDVIEAFTEGLEGIFATDTGNIIKYACRWNDKGNPIQDVEKIIWYATHLLEKLKEKNESEIALVTKIAPVNMSNSADANPWITVTVPNITGVANSSDL